MRSKIKRDLLITIRVNNYEKKLIDLNASHCGMDTADYLRRLGLSGRTIEEIREFLAVGVREAVLSSGQSLVDVSIEPHLPANEAKATSPSHKRPPYRRSA